MPIDPARIVILNDGGSANMGVLDFVPDSQAHFHLGGPSFALVFVRIHFKEGDGSKADVAIQVDSSRDDSYDTILYTFKDRGTGKDLNFRVPEDQLMHYVFQAGDELVLTWANPDTGNTVWGAEVGLLEVSDAIS